MPTSLARKTCNQISNASVKAHHAAAVIDREDGVHVYGHITVMLKGRLIADANIAEPTVFMLSAGQTYDAVVRAIPGPIKRPRVFTAPAERGWLLSLPVGD